MLKLTKLAKQILIGAAFLSTGMVFANETTNDDRMAIVPHVMSEKKVNQNLPTEQRLPREDIQRFVTAIAIIHRYYIKDVSNKELFDSAIRGMAASLDPHSSYLDANALKELTTTVSGEFVGIGIELTLQEGMLKVISPLEDSPAQKAGIKPDDYIIKVDKTLIRNISLDEAVKLIKGKPGTTVTLTVLRKGVDKPLQFTVVRDTIKLVAVKSELYDGGLGYIHITFFQGPVEKQLRNAIASLKAKAPNGKLRGLVLDLRNNPGGLLDVSAKVAEDFLESSQLTKYNKNIVYTKGRIPGADISIKATGNDLIQGVPMVLLINGGSASASEIVAGALQDYQRAIIMGTRSFGKGSVQTVLPLSQDSAIKLTTALYYTPAGRVIQAQGIIPDVTVPPLAVKDLDSRSFIIDEGDFQNHLNGATPKTKEELEARKKAIEAQLKVAKKDYQLYEALMMLEGLNAAKTRNNS